MKSEKICRVILLRAVFLSDLFCQDNLPKHQEMM